MKPIQVYLADDEVRRLDAWAQKRGWTKSDAVRAAVRALTASDDGDTLLGLSGMVYDRLPEDVSERFDQYLQETYIAEKPSSYRRAHSTKRVRR
jgi:hypothetical protein